MGNIDFNSFQNSFQNKPKSNSNNSDKPRVGFFSLKNDKDFAIVRFMIDKPEDFDIVAGHRMNINGYSRMVNCLRDSNDPVDKCPLCAADKKLEYKFYIHLIQYIPDETGKLIPVPKVWERSTTYVNTFNNYLNDYGPLSDCLFKVIRNGEARSRDTSYTINFLPPNSPVYNPEVYEKDTTLFKGYKAIGNAVWHYSREKMEELISADSKEGVEEQVTPRTTFATAEYPNPTSTSAPSTPSTPTQVPPAPVPPAPVPPAYHQATMPNNPTYTGETSPYNTNRRFVPPAVASDPVGVNRPVRTY